jgi:hypothetical protein
MTAIEDVHPASETEDALRLLKQEIDALQVHVLQIDKPWYKQASSIVAVLALTFSLFTTHLSYDRDRRLDQQANRAELRSLIQRLTALPRENFELLQKYKDDAAAAGQFSGFITSESVVLTNQALDIMQRIPDLVSASETLAVAGALVTSGRIADARRLTQRAAQDARASALEIIAAYRNLGWHAFANGQVEEGRRQFQSALDAFSGRADQASPQFINYTHTFTEMYWAQQEVLTLHCDAAADHLRRADELYTLNRAAFDPSVPQQLAKTREGIDQCRDGTSNAPLPTAQGMKGPPSLNLESAVARSLDQP